MDFSIIKTLNLPIGEYVIYGSGPLDIHGIRPSWDIDILVSENLWNELLARYPDKVHENPTKILLDEIDVEFFPRWINIQTPETEIIQNPEIIDDIAFARLKYVLEWKQNGTREKDIRDVELITNYLKTI